MRHRVIHTGMLDDVQLYLGIHSYPGFASGTLGIKEGPVMAAVDRFAITLTGCGAHGAQPHKGIDPIVVQAALVQSRKPWSAVRWILLRLRY